MLDRRISRRISAQGRLDHGAPVGVIDIGSNSVRLVVYEGLTRSPTPIFNEKVMAGLGRKVQSTGLLADDAVEKALMALRRFRALCGTMGVEHILGMATAACRDAENGPDFIRRAERICGARIDVLSGRREGKLAALGIISGINKPDGIVGDLGGGSLELIDIRGARVKSGVTLPLGGLALQDVSHKSLKEADAIVQEAFADVPMLKAGAGRDFYAVGGTWRALTRLHMWRHDYPLHVMHGYTIPAKDALEFARFVRRSQPARIAQIEAVTAARRPLLAYAAVVLEHLIRVAKPRQIIVSALGVREGLLYDLLDDDERKRDALLAAAEELNVLRSRSPRHGHELIAWTDRFVRTAKIEESADERRLRHAACLLADIGWRAHPDYRGEQSLNVIAHAAFVGVDHPGRAFLAAAVFFRHVGIDDELSPQIAALATPRLIERARILGSVMRVAYLVSAAMPGVLPHVALVVERGVLKLKLPGRYALFAGERLNARLKQLGKLLGLPAVMAAGES